MGNGLYTPAMQHHLQRVEDALPRYIPSDAAMLQRSVCEAMAYACSAGGKRLRPVLLMEFCRLCGGDTEAALPFACAVEMIHSYSLVHDDLPCMDDSPLRRGRPSAHVRFGETTALLAGDALLNRAFEIMLSPVGIGSVDPRAALQAAFSLADGAGVFGMVGGQVIDLESENRHIDLNTLEELQRGKTAALIRSACEMGCFLAQANEEKRYVARAFGEQLGLCFQIVDDILDATSTAEELGKPVSSDAQNNKATYVTLLGLDQARQLAQKRTQQAVDALHVFGTEAQGLQVLAEKLLNRNH